MRSSLWLLVVFFASACRQQQTGSPEINALYNAVSKNRYAVHDSMKFYADLIEKKTHGKAPVYRAMAAICKGLYFSRISSYPASLTEYQRALRLLKTDGPDSLLGKAYNGIGAAFKNVGDYPQAIENFQQALHCFEKDRYAEGIAGVNSNLALTYQMKGDSILARRHLLRGMAAVKETKSSKAYLHLLHLTANSYAYSGALDSAMTLDDEGIALATQMNLPMLLSPFLDNKANCFVQKGRTDSARFYFQRSLAIDSTIGNTKQVADTYLNLAKMERKEKNGAMAESHFLKSISLSQKSGYRHGERDAWKGLSQVYEERSDLQRALQAQNQSSVLNDSIVNESTEKRIAELQTGFETEKKERQIQAQAYQLEQQRMLIGTMIVAGIFAVLAGYTFYRRRQTKKQAQLNERLLRQQQEATIQILTAEEKERQRIALDLHDGIGQTMTAAWLNLQALSKRLSGHREEAELVGKTTALVSDSCTEIRQVSHNMMPNALQRKGLVNAVKELTGQLDDKIISVHLQADEDKLQLEPTTELILYRVIQECVNNVVKHAGATELDISIVSDRDGLDILIEDNGSGFHPDKDPVAKGLGIQNIRSRIRYLNGTVEWDNTGSGTVVAIHIPDVHA